MITVTKDMGMTTGTEGMSTATTAYGMWGFPVKRRLVLVFQARTQSNNLDAWVLPSNNGCSKKSYVEGECP